MGLNAVDMRDSVANVTSTQLLDLEMSTTRLWVSFVNTRKKNEWGKSEILAVGTYD